VSPVTPAQLVDLDKIRFEQQAWPRRFLDVERVEDFAVLFEEQGVTALPPLELVDDGAGRFLIADGVHRREAARQAGLTEVLAGVHAPEPALDPITVAYLRALACSAISSKPLTRAERWAAIRKLIRAQPNSSDREIARLVACDHKTVARQRQRLRIPDLLGDGAATAIELGPSPEAVAKQLFKAFEKAYEARGLGVLDLFAGDRTGQRLAGVLTDVYGDQALARARTFSGWLDQAVDSLEAEEAG
jgi:ParB-like chromosome segregation protein Spo0J